ncbi:hypothetical protein BC629DRAFT_1571904 [Irpex lacteus]|nr:hypothetical protein BC629DRAFT_1571904 [Irpex lacteus]
MAVTHVCRRMRQVSLGFPVLWTSVLVVEDSASWLPTILQRSADQSLSLAFPDTGLPSSLEDTDVQLDEVIKEACTILYDPRHLSRIKHATTVSLSNWLPFVRSFLTSPVPQLDTLRMGPEYARKMMVLPQTLFGHNTLALSFNPGKNTNSNMFRRLPN